MKKINGLMIFGEGDRKGDRKGDREERRSPMEDKVTKVTEVTGPLENVTFDYPCQSVYGGSPSD
jgi:hypothetical protein